MGRKVLAAAGLLLIGGMLAACRVGRVRTVTVPITPTYLVNTNPGEREAAVLTATPDSTATQTATPTITPIPTVTPFPADLNPLTGLPPEDPAALERRPLLIRVSNFPAVVRPQNGLSYADHVWEHIVEGWKHTRLTAVFYGQTPESVGSVRSGRLPDLDLVPMYDGLYYASGFSSRGDGPGPDRMRELMQQADWFERNFSADFGVGKPYGVRLDLEGVSFEHTLFALPPYLWELADERGVNGQPELSPGWAFSQLPSDEGTPATAVIIDYPLDGAKAEWRYDAASGSYLRWTDDVEHGDYLTGEQLAFENVVVLYARHYEADFIEYESPTARMYSIGFDLLGEGEAILLRDGHRYDLQWQRENPKDMIQFLINGRLVPLKPGATWFNVVADEGNMLPTVNFVDGD